MTSIIILNINQKKPLATIPKKLFHQVTTVAKRRLQMVPVCNGKHNNEIK